MLRALCRRLATASGTLVLVTLVVFALVRAAPGDPVLDADDAGPRLPAESLRELRRLYRLDLPLHRQYLAWLGDALSGDLGRSHFDGRPVVERIGQRIGITLLLNAFALGLTVAVALPLGALAAGRPRSGWDRGTALSAYVLYAIPVFWAALMLQTLFAVRLEWLPLAGLRSYDAELLGPLARAADRALHLVLPVVCLSYGGVAYVSRFVRAALLDAATAETWRAARARGLSTSAVLRRHGLRQAALPLLTLAGFLLPALVSGSIIVEEVFAIPGLGRLFYAAVMQRDVALLMGLVLLSSVATLAGIVGADVTYALADPRVRRG